MSSCPSASARCLRIVGGAGATDAGAPRKRAYFIVAMYLQGWVTDEEFLREIERLKQQDALKKT